MPAAVPLQTFRGSSKLPEDRDEPVVWNGIVAKRTFHLFNNATDQPIELYWYVKICKSPEDVAMEDNVYQHARCLASGFTTSKSLTEEPSSQEAIFTLARILSINGKSRASQGSFWECMLARVQW
jgi:hypothetical protein